MIDEIIKPFLFALLVVITLIFSLREAEAAPFSKDYFYNVTVVSVYDGDTLTVESEIWPQHTINTNIRLYGIDTPEKTWRAKCDREKVLALNARDYLTNIVNQAKLSNNALYITNVKFDKYAKRFVAKLMIGNVSASDMLINAGHAVEYFGKGTKKDWCI